MAQAHIQKVVSKLQIEQIDEMKKARLISIKKVPIYIGNRIVISYSAYVLKNLGTLSVEWK
jgi:hypothetical protein